MKLPILPLAAVFAMLGAAPNARAQEPPTPAAKPAFTDAQVATMRRIAQAALGDDYAYEQLRVLTQRIGPRLSGSAGAAAAVEYVSAELAKQGLTVTREKVTVPHWVRGRETAELVGYPGQPTGLTQKVVLTALGGSVATPDAGLTAPVVVVTDFNAFAALSREQVAGRIILFDHAFDKQLAADGQGGAAYSDAVAYRTLGASVAARKGAVAVLVRSVGGADYRLPHTGTMHYATDAPKVPTAAVSAEDADTIASLSVAGPVTMHLTLTPQTLPDAESANVIADLKGSVHPEQVVIVSGHLDSWDLGQGAIDDGAGVVIAMQAAHLLQKLGIHPKRTIRVIAWMNEENGGAGGKAYARDHAATAADHIAAIESDLGADHPLGFEAKIPRPALLRLASVAGVLGEIGSGLSRTSEGTESDVGPLSLLGVPAYGVWQDARFYFNYHHTAADTFDKVDPHHLRENAAVMAVLAYALADSDEALSR